MTDRPSTASTPSPTGRVELTEVAAAMMRGELTCEKGHRPGKEHVHFDDVHRWGQRIARVAHERADSPSPEGAPLEGPDLIYAAMEKGARTAWPSPEPSLDVDELERQIRAWHDSNEPARSFAERILARLRGTEGSHR